MGNISKCYEEKVADLYMVDEDGRLWRTTKDGKPRKVPADRTVVNGYRHVWVVIDKHPRRVAAHRISAFKAHGRIGPNRVVNHINGIKTDNRPHNLEIVTVSENTKHAARTLGKKWWKTKLSDEDIPEILRLIEGGMTQKAVGVQFGVTRSAISKVVTGKNWNRC